MAYEKKPEVSVKKAAPEFDPSRPYTDAIEKQQKYMVQNGWLYKRGSAEPVREA